MADVHSLKHYLAQAIRWSDTPFAALVFLGSLRDSYSACYLHEGWEQIASAEQVHSLLRDTHRAAFDSVLGLSLTDLSMQLRLHFQKLERPEHETAVWWLEGEPFRELIPQGCSPVLRELFISKIRMSLEALRRAADWPELAVPGALLRQQPDLSLLLPWLN